jgi:hypothetical protein
LSLNASQRVSVEDGNGMQQNCKIHNEDVTKCPSLIFIGYAQHLRGMSVGVDEFGNNFVVFVRHYVHKIITLILQCLQNHNIDLTMFTKS